MNLNELSRDGGARFIVMEINACPVSSAELIYLKDYFYSLLGPLSIDNYE